MASLNQVTLLGNLTRDPQVKYLPSGSAVCDIGLALNHTWNDKATNQKKETVTFVDVTLFGRTAEIAGEYLAKGRQAIITGRLQTDTWEDKATGQKRSKLKVVGDSLVLLGNKGEAPAKQSESDDTPKWQDDQSTGGAGPSDEVPF